MSKQSQDGMDLASYYAHGFEQARLARGTGELEFVRTQQLLQRYLPAPPADIADIGGGPGRYALWLADQGYGVRLVDPVPLHVEQAHASVADAGLESRVTTHIGDARALQLGDQSVDAVLLLGPLYHLPEKADRIQALSEARRICRSPGVIVAAAISRFASTLDGLRGGYLADPAFAVVAAEDRTSGRHENPTSDPAYFTTAYFHSPDDLAAECELAGLSHQATLAVEGPAWLLGDLESRMDDTVRRKVLLDAIDAMEGERSLIGVSAHLLVIARRG